MDNLRCGRQCDFINRPAYIVLFKGDDSDFQGNQSVDIVIDTELDTTGMKAHFRFMDFVQDFNSIPENKTLSLVFPNAKTSEFPLGAADATLRFEDASGKFRTVSNRIHIVVTNSVHEAYDNEDSQSITVTVKGTVTWDMIEGKPVFADVATSGSYNDLTDKPAIPAPVTIDPALSPTSVNPVQNKVVTEALYTGFTEWKCDSIASGYTFVSCVWDDYMGDTGWICTVLDDNDFTLMFYLGSNQEATSLSFDSPSIVITRHLVTPTKTSQLTNDGPSSGPNVGHPFATTNQIPAPVDISGKLDDSATYDAWEQPTEYSIGEVVSYKGFIYRCINEGNHGIPPDGEYGPNVWTPTRISELLGGKQDKLSDTQIGYINSVPSKADKAVPSAAGNLASLNAQGNLADSGAKPSDFATPSDLPYAMVTLSAWEVSSGLPTGITVAGIVDVPEVSQVQVFLSNESNALYDVPPGATELTIDDLATPPEGDYPVNIVLSRLSALQLLDRAGNRVVVSGDTTLTLPAAIPGHIRDFLVRLEISGSTVPTITFAAPTGETIVYETDGDDFPVPDEAGTWLYSFTESCVAHTFAVSLKKVNEVAAPQAQGGS